MKIPSYPSKPENGCLRCLIGGDWVQARPEEKVRQRVLNYLLKDLKYDKLHIELEERINYNKKKKRALNREFGRADIMILDKKEEPWLIVECKRSHVDSGKKTKNQLDERNIEQAKGYAEAKGVNKIWVTTGDENIFQKKHGASWRNDNLFGLNDTEFSSCRIQFPESNSTRDDLSNYFKKDCYDENYKNYFDESTCEAKFVFSIQKLIHKLNFEKWVAADKNKRRGFRIVKDLGVTRESFGNPGYGSKAYQNRYRTIACKYDGIELIMSLGINVYPQAQTSVLCIGVRSAYREEGSNGHHSLQFNYQRYVSMEENNFVLRHTRGIGGGQLTPGKGKFSELIKCMENHDVKEVRDLIKRDTGSNPRVELGSMPLFWSKTTDGLLSLVRNLFLYGAVRHVYKEKYKKQD